MRHLPLAVAALATFAMPAAAQVAPAPGPQAVPVAFKPPTDRPIRIRAEQTRSILVNGQAELALAVETTDELRFTPNAEGWLLRWSSNSIKVNGQAATGARKIDQQWIDVPIEYQLSRTGQPMRVLNWEAYQTQATRNWAMVEKQAEEDVAKLPEAEREGARLSSARLIAALRMMTEAKTPRDLIAQPGMLFAFGGRELKPGTPSAFQTTVANPEGPASITLAGQARVQANPDGTLSVEVVASNAGAAGVQPAAATGGAVAMFNQESTLKLRPADGTPVDAMLRRTSIVGPRVDMSMTRLTRSE